MSAEIDVPRGYLVTEGLGGWFVTHGPAAPQFAISQNFHQSRDTAVAEAWHHANRAADAALEYQADFLRAMARRKFFAP